MNRVTPLTEISNMELVARDLYTYLSAPTNRDIADEFPATLKRYGTNPSSCLNNLYEAKDLCTPGRRAQFIVFAGETAVGMSIITVEEDAPTMFTPGAPLLSGFICHPWRYQGLGSLSLTTRLRTVDTDFGGEAYTIVKSTNTTSRHMVEKCGMEYVSTVGYNSFYSYPRHSEATA